MKFKINVPIWEYTVWFTDSYEEAYKMTGVEPDGEIVTFGCGTTSVIFIAKELELTPIKFIQALSHECNHAAMDTLKRKGVKADWDNQEPLCYLQDYLIHEILKKGKFLDEVS